MGERMISATDLHHAYGRQEVLRGVSLHLEPGETLVILGGSGSGKSTMLRVLCGLLTCDAGEIRVEDGRCLREMDEREREKWRMGVGVVFQNAALLGSLSVFENVALPLRMHRKLDEPELKVLVEDLLGQVALDGAGRKMPQELSGGMRKRAGLARALAMNPNIIFYDEPSAGLDPVSAGRIDRLILERAKSGTAQIVVTHEMGSAFRIADRMVLLHQGHMVAEGTPEEFQNSSDPRIRQFVEGGADGPLEESAS